MLKRIGVLVVAVLALLATSWATKPEEPPIVAKYSATSQTANIGSTILFSPGSGDSENYRVSVYTVYSGSGSCSGGSWDVQLVYENEFVNAASTDTNGACALGTGASATYFIHAITGSNITFNVSVSGTATYDVFIIVEEL